jgi:hypothetical protein
MLRQGADVVSGRLGGAKLEETGVWSINGPGRSPTWWATFPEQREGEYRPSSSFAETKRPEPTSARYRPNAPRTGFCQKKSFKSQILDLSSSTVQGYI